MSRRDKVANSGYDRPVIDRLADVVGFGGIRERCFENEVEFERLSAPLFFFKHSVRSEHAKSPDFDRVAHVASLRPRRDELVRAGAGFGVAVAAALFALALPSTDFFDFESKLVGGLLPFVVARPDDLAAARNPLGALRAVLALADDALEASAVRFVAALVAPAEGTALSRSAAFDFVDGALASARFPTAARPFSSDRDRSCRRDGRRSFGSGGS